MSVSSIGQNGVTGTLSITLKTGGRNDLYLSSEMSTSIGFIFYEIRMREYLTTLLFGSFPL